MSVTRRLLRSAAIAAASALALVSLTACTASDPAGSPTAAVVPDFLWDATAVHSIALDISPDEFDAIVASYRESGARDWARASITVDGTSLDDVGVALADSATLDPDSTDVDLAGLPLVISFDKFVDGQQLDGETALRLSANASATGLNESVALELLAITGLSTESAVPTSFTVNGGTARLRLAVQQLDEAWVADQFDAGDSLYLAQPGGDFRYRGDSADAYDGTFEQVAGSTDSAPLARLLKFAEKSSDSAFADDLHTYLDVDSFAAYLAFQKLVRQDDGPRARTALEYSDTTKLITVVPWDLSSAFTASDSSGADGPVPDALAARFLAVPEFVEVYDQAVIDATSLLFDTGTAESILDDQTAVLTAQASDLVSKRDTRRESKALDEKILSRSP